MSGVHTSSSGRLINLMPPNSFGFQERYSSFHFCIKLKYLPEDSSQTISFSQTHKIGYIGVGGNKKVTSSRITFFLEAISLFVWPLAPLYWTFSDVCNGFQNPSGSVYLHASLPVCDGFFGFPRGAIPTSLLGLITYFFKLY